MSALKQLGLRFRSTWKEPGGGGLRELPSAMALLSTTRNRTDVPNLNSVLPTHIGEMVSPPIHVDNLLTENGVDFEEHLCIGDWVQEAQLTEWTVQIGPTTGGKSGLLKFLMSTYERIFERWNWRLALDGDGGNTKMSVKCCCRRYEYETA